MDDDSPLPLYGVSCVNRGLPEKGILQDRLVERRKMTLSPSDHIGLANRFVPPFVKVHNRVRGTAIVMTVPVIQFA